MNPSVSIIVPVYNTAKYLCRCLDSILQQSFNDFEVLLVDDGSTDNSGEICDEYALKDSRIRVFHKGNGGVASAREIGNENAVGFYSIHVDSDDWIEKKMLERMYEEAQISHWDVLIADFYNDDKGETIYIHQQPSASNSEQVLKDILQNKLFGSLWHKLIRHSLYREYNIHFIEEINYCEDVLVLVQLLQHSVRVGFMNEAFYHYDFSNTNSITRNYTINTFRMRKQFVFKLKELLPISYADIIKEVAIKVKKEAFTAKILPKQEFLDFMPMSVKDIVLSPVLGRKVKICMLVAKLGFYNMSMNLSVFINAK